MLHTKRDYLHISDQCSIDTSSTMKKKRSEKIKYYPYHPKLVGTILQPTKIGQQENNSKKTTSKCTLLWRKNYFNKVISIYYIWPQSKKYWAKIGKMPSNFSDFNPILPKMYYCILAVIWLSGEIEILATVQPKTKILW